MAEFLIGLSEEDATFLARIALAFVVCLGAIIGSFLNVCIYRIPLEQSVSRPRSHCFSCGKTIRWYHNIPVLAWFFLRGKCAYCKTPVSFRYPAIEAITAMLFLMVFQMWGNPAIFGLNPLSIPELIPIYWLFVASTVVNIMIDIDHRILLDRISLGGTVLALAAAAAFPAMHGELSWWHGLCDAMGGAAVGFGIGFAIAFLGERIFLQDAFGFGDVKWMMLFGALFGWNGLLWILLMASFLGLIMGVGALIYNRIKHLSEEGAVAIPFGPALGVAALIWLFWSRRLLDGFAWLREQALLHETAMLYGLIPVLLVMMVWLCIRIVAIRRYNRALAEAEAAEGEVELTPVADETQDQEAPHA